MHKFLNKIISFVTNRSGLKQMLSACNLRCTNFTVQGSLAWAKILKCFLLMEAVEQSITVQLFIFQQWEINHVLSVKEFATVLQRMPRELGRALRGAVAIYKYEFAVGQRIRPEERRTPIGLAFSSQSIVILVSSFFFL